MTKRRRARVLASHPGEIPGTFFGSPSEPVGILCQKAREVVAYHGGNVQYASDAVGISASTLYELLKDRGRHDMPTLRKLDNAWRIIGIAKANNKASGGRETVQQSVDKITDAVRQALGTPKAQQPDLSAVSISQQTVEYVDRPGVTRTQTIIEYDPVRESRPPDVLTPLLRDRPETTAPAPPAQPKLEPPSSPKLYVCDLCERTLGIESFERENGYPKRSTRTRCRSRLSQRSGLRRTLGWKLSENAIQSIRTKAEVLFDYAVELEELAALLERQRPTEQPDD